MKIITIVLAVIMLFLIGKSGINSISLQGQNNISCCGAQCDADDTQSNDDNQCDSRNCNPFQGCCIWTTTQRINHIKLTFNDVPTPSKIARIKSSTLSLLVFDSWKPPRY